MVGLEGRIVEVEADIGAGLPRTVLVGLPYSALYQSRGRCKAAVSNSEQEWPISLLTINLSPATLPKAGSHYDVAIVAAVLAAQGVFRSEELRVTVLLGELGLDGRLRPVRGVLPATLAAQQAGFTRVIVPLRQAGEAKLVEGIGVFGIASITQLVAFLRGAPIPPVDPVDVMGERAGRHAKCRLDVADVVGQAEAKWACEVAQQVGITCCSTARQGSARPCSLSVSRACSLISLCMTRSKCLQGTHLLASTLPTSSSPARRTATRIIRHRWPASSVAVSEWPGRAPSHVHTKPSYFSTTPRKPKSIRRVASSYRLAAIG